ncbi:MAG: diaminopimelate decarboxylase [Bifidobacteriaceae bacterium]|jgi:diaminopimelate decarboxylase|nr:diaminopimelate decarboxylase [Bifidobacteriaceae bacterium]
MRSHEAGAVHGQGDAPAWLLVPENVNDLMRELWPATAFKADDGVLQVGGLSATQIAAQVGTPAYILDEADFRSRAALFRDAFADAFAPLAGADVYYAGKALLSRGIVRWINQDGLGLDVCSSGELGIALAAGMPAQRMTLHGNNKSDSEIRRALEAGIGRIAIDSQHEIGQVARIAAELGVTAAVMIRVRVGVEAHTHEYIATAHEDQKFGFSLAGGDAFAAAARITETPGLRLLGLHSHIGSQIFDAGGFRESIRRTVSLHAQVAARLGVHLEELGLGGGFGVAYTTGQDPAGAREIAAQLARAVAAACAGEGVAAPRISVEPGRAIAGPAGLTLYTVGAVKPVALDGGFTRLYVAVDGGMSDNIRAALYSADYSATLASRRSAAPPALARVVGKHCESGDMIVKDEYLPADIAAGDLLAVPVTGAYCRSLSSNYNEALRPPLVAVRDGALRTLVRRETEQDRAALDCD